MFGIFRPEQKCGISLSKDFVSFEIKAGIFQYLIDTDEFLLIDTLITGSAGNSKKQTQIKSKSFHNHHQISDKITKKLLHL